MAKFNFEFSDSGGYLSGERHGDALTVDDLLEVLRPAGLKLKECYQQAIRSTFRQRTGSLADSIDIEDNYVGSGYASITVKPFGSHKGGAYQRRSRAGSPTAKGAKHNRKPSKKAIKNEELLYLLEHGTPRITASHVIENTNDAVMEEIQDVVEDNFTELLKKKGLI